MQTDAICPAWSSVPVWRYLLDPRRFQLAYLDTCQLIHPSFIRIQLLSLIGLIDESSCAKHGLPPSRCGSDMDPCAHTLGAYSVSNMYAHTALELRNLALLVSRSSEEKSTPRRLEAQATADRPIRSPDLLITITISSTFACRQNPLFFLGRLLLLFSKLASPSL